MARRDVSQSYSVDLVVESNPTPGEFPRKYYFVLKPVDDPQQLPQRIEISMELYQDIIDQGYVSGDARMSLTLNAPKGKLELIVNMVKEKPRRR